MYSCALPLRGQQHAPAIAHRACTPAQVPIFQLLSKFNGETVTDDIRAGRRRFRIMRLPPYLGLQMRRMTKNNFFVEKNATLVTFPVRGLDLRDCIPLPEGTYVHMQGAGRWQAGHHASRCYGPCPAALHQQKNAEWVVVHVAALSPPCNAGRWK